MRPYCSRLFCIYMERDILWYSQWYLVTRTKEEREEKLAAYLRSGFFFLGLSDLESVKGGEEAVRVGN